MVYFTGIRVAFNTDDLGVFGTSRENAYAILAASLQRMSDANGKQYLPDSICSYLENVHRMGIEQSFLLLMDSLTRHKLRNCQTQSRGIERSTDDRLIGGWDNKNATN